ncbi:hypothetical protein [Streptomyces olivochromogenes]|uniref:Calcium-binding protein n=1 Tax=Streptomyces olivochromogenes TaxID=1963 RepID=A0A250VDV1_STROL|nr:hypothetical protein [Streptomyces olivochromogenes]KUN46897.1 hypothetical protein AQJ27_14085 [Streptomyces olivochromogenes]GAX52383.1 hypothetical protein SO3561_03897 [Streptomyces olivochromogenes]
MKTDRRTVAVATLVGALGLSVLNAPTAQAADTGITVSDIVINNGKPIVAGTSKEVEPPISFNIALPSGYSTANPSRYDAYPFLYRGSIKTAADTGENFIGPGGYTCYEIDSKHARCEGNLYIDPHPSQDHVDSNSDATTWKVGVSLRLWKADGGLKTGELETRSTTAQLKRAAKATANASPEPVTKGKSITVTGKLTRANWSTKKYDAYSGRTVSLQFRAKGADTFKTVKKATTSSTGGLKVTVTASVDGSYRWVYSGNSTTGVATSAADYVDVR